MPDGLTHMLTAYLSLRNRLSTGSMSLFLVGSLLPDVFLRGGRLLLPGSSMRDFLELYLAPLHTPFAVAFVCLAIAQFFHSEIRRKSFMLLYSGCLTHFILDLFQLSITGFGFTVEPLDGYHWLFPFSRFDFQIGLFWAEDAPYALLLLVPLTAWICLAAKKKLNGGLLCSNGLWENET